MTSRKESKEYGAVINGTPVEVIILRRGRFFTLVSYEYAIFYADYNYTDKSRKAKWILTSKLIEVESKTFKEEV